MKSAPPTEIVPAFTNLNPGTGILSQVLLDTSSGVTGRTQALGLFYSTTGSLAIIYLMQDRSLMTCEEAGGANALGSTSALRMC